jgi:hypothetical protein
VVHAGIVSKSQKIPEFRPILEFATDTLAFAADAAGRCFDWCFGTSVLPFYGNSTMAIVRTCAARRRSYTLRALQSKAVSAASTYTRPFTHAKRPSRQRLRSNGVTRHWDHRGRVAGPISFQKLHSWK